MNIEKIIQKCIKKRQAEPSPQQIPSRGRSFSSTRKCYQPELPLFKPNVNELPLSLYKPSHKTECSKEEIFERLTVDKKEEQDRRIEEKIKKQQKDFKNKCTFMPYLNPNSKKIAKTECSEDDPFERLYSKGIEKLKTSEALNFSSQNQIQFPFKPETNYKKVLNCEMSSSRPIYQRIEEIIQRKREYLKSLQEKENDKNKENVSLNPVSHEIIEKKAEFKKNVLERLQTYWHEQKQKKQLLLKEQQQKMKRKCPFKPEINSYSLLEKDFSIRQEEFINHLNTKISSQIKQIESGFQPEINRISNLLTKSERQTETWEDKINRHHYGNEEKYEKLNEIQRQLYQQCTFEPEINQISKALNAKHKKHTCDHMPKEQEYEFRPKINKLSEHIVKINRESQVKRTERSMVKENLDQIKMSLQYKEMKECTFTPKMVSSKPKRNGSISNVPGFDKYAKKVQTIQAKKAEKEKLHEKVFQMEKQYKSRKCTSTKQFNLSQGCNTKRVVKKEMQAQFQKKCTFHPQINRIR